MVSIYHKGHRDLTDFSVPEGVEEILSSAFQDCTALVSIQLPGSLKSIGSWAFAGCTSLKQIIVPEGVEEIGASAFADCIALREVKLPSTLRKIGGNVFYHCMSLTRLHIPENAVELGADLFGWKIEDFYHAEHFFIPNVNPDSLRPEARTAFQIFYLTTRKEHSPQEQETYERSIRAHAEEVTKAIFHAGNMAALAELLEMRILNAENLESSIEYASRFHLTEVSAFLMDYKNTHEAQEAKLLREKEWEL